MPNKPNTTIINEYIEDPLMNDYCEKCIYSREDDDDDDFVCVKSKLWGSYVPCGGITLCGTYKPKEGEDHE